LHDVFGTLRAIQWNIVSEIVNIRAVIHVCVAEEKTIYAARFFRRESTMVEIIATIDSFQIRKQTELKEIEYTVALAGLHELVKILIGETETHPKVEKQLRFGVFN
jgi:hypothetical protein